jgi:hypothetical protein
MKKNIKPLSIVLTVFVTIFLFVLIFPSFKSQAGVLGDTYLYLSRIKAGLNGAAGNEVEMVLAITPSQAFYEANTIQIEIQFPMADNAQWCRTAGALTVTGVASAPPDITGTEITAALPPEGVLSLLASCTQGNGTTTVDTITITQVGDLVNTQTYGVKLENNVGILGTSATSGSRTVTVQLSDANNLDSKAFSVYLITEDTVTVTATVASAPTVTCTINPTTTDIGTLYPGGALVTTVASNQITTSSSNGGYYWAVYGLGDGTNAGLYNSVGATYLLNSGATTVDLTGADTKGFGLTVSPPAGATVATDFQEGTPGIFGVIVANTSGAKLLMYKETATSPSHSASITYGARADSGALTGSYTEYVTYVCGGYY